MARASGGRIVEIVETPVALRDGAGAGQLKRWPQRWPQRWPGAVAVIGGGRWARVMTRVVATSGGALPDLHLVSSRNAEAMSRWLTEEVGQPWAIDVHVHDDLEAVLHNDSVVAAVVANLPAEHHATTLRLLEAGKHVLVEKPIAPTLAEAAQLVEVAEASGLVLAVNHELLLAHHVARLATLVDGLAEPPSRVAVTWHDPVDEARWGETKRPDVTTNVVTDLYPHVLSLLAVLGGRWPATTGRVRCSAGGWAAELALRYGLWDVDVSLSRVAAAPRREIVVTAESGAVLRLDFTTEPGRISLEGVDFGLGAWAVPDAPRPLDAQVAVFRAELNDLTGSSPALASRNLWIVAATEDATKLVTEAQVTQLERAVMGDQVEPATDDVVALRQHLAVPLLQAGLVSSPKDEVGLSGWTRVAFDIIRRLAHQPFTSEATLARDLGLDRSALRDLNRAIRQSDVAQHLITRGGTGAKYWVNTVIPLMSSGAVDATLQGVPHYPFRVGLYPGLSCMFACTFCGRERDAVYPRSAVEESHQSLTDILRAAPADDPHRFYISGGLEPLTNPAIGKIIRVGAERGFRLSMYTNGFLLTEGLVARRVGLWDLDTLRISVYGADEVAARSVTGRKGSFTQVMRNAGEFLRMRNERRSPLKLGFNFVVLPGSANEVLELAEVIAQLNRQVGGDRGIDFLTLREDYSVTGEDAIQSAERAQLIDVVGQLEERRRRDDLASLEIDYGYALQAAKQGRLGMPLQMVDHAGMRPAGYPQISVVVDPFGDVYLYREAGFLDRPGADRYIVGRAGPDRSFEQVVADFVRSGRTILPAPGDTGFLDIFDHVVTLLLNQADADAATGIPFNDGPVRGRSLGAESSPLAHPTLVGSR